MSVDYATANGSAVAPDDYLAAAGTLTFDPGQTSKTVTVQVKGDKADEPDETFSVDLPGATNATIADATGVGTISDDDTAPPDPVPPDPAPGPPPAPPVASPSAATNPPAPSGSTIIPPAAASPASAFRLPSNRSCLRRPSQIRLAYRKPKGVTIDRVEVWIGTKRLTRRSGASARRSINVRAGTARRFTLTVKVKPRGGETVTIKRAYTVCPAKSFKATQAFRLPSKKACLRRPARLRLRYRKPRGVTVDRVEVWVGGKRRVRRSGRSARRSVVVRGLPSRRFTLKIRVRTRGGRTVSARRTYKVCAR